MTAVSILPVVTNGESKSVTTGESKSVTKPGLRYKG